MAGLTPIYNSTFADCDCEEPITEQNFRAAEDLKEGISGRRRIDSTYDMPNEDLVSGKRPENDTDKSYRNWK